MVVCWRVRGRCGSGKAERVVMGAVVVGRCGLRGGQEKGEEAVVVLVEGGRDEDVLELQRRRLGMGLEVR